MRYWFRNRMAGLQLAVTGVLATVCTLTDPGEVAVPPIFGSISAVMVLNNVFGLVLAIIYAVGLARADLTVEDRSLRGTGILDASLGVAMSAIMLLGLLGGPGNASVVRDVPILLGITMVAARWMPRSLASLPSIAYFFVGLLVGRSYDGETWWNWSVSSPSGCVSQGWIISSVVLGVLALVIPTRRVRQHFGADAD
ncbi:hypothetical protein [Cutibacterium avidum]|uniref:hypothetical protein n=1 Tax=Cutibacterium TaxID=1912216 RepID=UPI00083E8EAA|nr:hypothetical protein [Cutibacterium avidum]AOG28196.1 hypothetical protein BFS79_06340 [Cutibacterium avidum]